MGIALKYLCFVTIFVTLSLIVKAQTGEAHYKYGNVALDRTIQKNFALAGQNVGQIDACMKSLTFAKFTILPNGTLSTIQFVENETTPPVFRNILTKVIESTAGNWIPKTVNGKPVESRPFILPLFYDMEAGCFINKKKVEDGTENAVSLFFSTLTGASKSGGLDCVLLTGLRMFSVN